MYRLMYGLNENGIRLCWVCVEHLMIPGICKDIWCHV